VLHEALERFNEGRLTSYVADKGLLREHFGIEETVLAGGYGYRQVLELVQNGADALLEARQPDSGTNREGRIHVQLRGQHLYVANTGAPLSEDGLDALLRSHSSPKRGDQIGRFGLGFKSLLKLKGRIDVFTHASGAIRFDPERCRDELRRRFQVEQAPGLRLAWPLHQTEREVDPVCAELDWAETIIRAEVGSDDLLDHIRQEIQTFPAEFLLFFPLTTALSLDDGSGISRRLRLSVEDGEHVLYDGDSASRWQIATRQVRIEKASAIADATHIHARESVPVSWAMPLEGRREEVGRFWAFFPTHTLTYLPGILNAPWKLNSDRNAIIGGEWNVALMAEAARLIADTLPSLSVAHDPARHLDAFPRQLDRRDEDAGPLVESLWSALKDATVIPDGTGALRCAKDLWRHPKDSVEIARSWQLLAGVEARGQLVHSSCLERQRASRLNALAERIEPSGVDGGSRGLDRCDAPKWFGMVASTETEIAQRVLRLAGAYASDVKPGEWNLARPSLAIVPTETGALTTPAGVVLAPAGVAVPDRQSVAAELLRDPEAKRLLKDVLNVREVDAQLWLLILNEGLRKINRARPEKDEDGWRALWTRLRAAPEAVCKQFIETASSNFPIRARRRDGEWANAHDLLLPGMLVSDSDAENATVLVDQDFHSGDATLLDRLGVSSQLNGTDALVDVRWRSIYRDWNAECVKRWFADAYKGGSRPQGGYLQPLEGRVPRGIDFVSRLRGLAKARLCATLCGAIPKDGFGEVPFGHYTRPDAYPKARVGHPLPWLLLRHGELCTASGEIIPLRALVARADETALRRLSIWNVVEPALSILGPRLGNEIARAADLHVLWKAAIRELATPENLVGDSLIGLWTGAAKDGIVPMELPTSAGAAPLSSVFVTTSADLAKRARSAERTVVVLDPPTLMRWVQAGARDLTGLMQAEWDALSGPPDRLMDAIPDLGEVVAKSAREIARCQPVKGLRLRIGESSEATPCLMWEGALLLDTEQLAPLSRAERLKKVLGELGASGWLALTPEEALSHLGDAGVESRRARVAEGATLGERLLRAVGERHEPLLNVLGQALRDLDIVRGCTLQQLAELVLAQLGPSALTALRDTLREEGLKPPERWGGQAAIAFVASIGFPPAFAASPEARREPEELVSGPIHLPPLHNFQLEVFEGLKTLISSGTKRRRAVVSLPTGGGKTRVTVESAVRLVLAPEGASRCVLWIAQTDELCEQAVQAFRQVWVNLGAQRTNLRVARLWGGNPNPVSRDPDKPVVVVASIQTLNSRVGAADLDWLRRVGLVVVDECHHAITPSYTALLRWLDAEAPRPGAAERDEPLIVGLSATPFRTDDEESQRLARRFDSRWLPGNQEELYGRLRSQGVLARASYESLDTGAGLTDEEISRLASLPDPWEGLDFENLLEAINQRLAGDASRNERLVKYIEECSERAILFFTNSVAHAEEMAARLNLAGIEAAAVSGSTPSTARRYFLDRFQDGQIRVLCNHSVLTTGFDAPKTDMVLIARQVFSPVRYMQMVGRGLRGTENGGTASCRIVTVLDNLGRFADRHPYHYCLGLYGEGA
jgi:superfamily II DNA or RNA helicase